VHIRSRTETDRLDQPEQTTCHSPLLTPFFSAASVCDAWDALIIPMGMCLRRVAIPVSLSDVDRRLLGTAAEFVKCGQRGKCGRQARAYTVIISCQPA